LLMLSFIIIRDALINFARRKTHQKGSHKIILSLNIVMDD